MLEDNIDNNYNFTSFLNEWSEAYKKVKNILSYLGSYPEVLSEIELNDLLDSNSIDSSQKEWIWLSSKLNHPIDKIFFKQYWIPIQKNSYDYFIDISDELFPIFEIQYFFFEPYRWYKKFIANDISELLLAPDDGRNLQQLLEINDKKRWENVSELFEERMNLGFLGKLNVKEVSSSEIILSSKSEILINKTAKEFITKISEITPLIVGLLPFTLTIKLLSIQYLHGQPFKDLEKIRTIRDLVFLIRTTGMKRIASYHFEFQDNLNGYVQWGEDEFRFKSPTIELQNDFIKEWDRLGIIDAE